jgi:hypothetical protein
MDDRRDMYDTEPVLEWVDEEENNDEES